MQIEHLRSQHLRTDALLSLLKVAKANIGNINLVNAASSTIGMLNEMDKSELIPELDFAIKLLSDFLTSNSYSIVIPSNEYSRDYADRFNSIKDKMVEIINRYETDLSK